MDKFFSLLFFAAAVFVTPVSSVIQFGKGAFVIQANSDFACKPFGFDIAYTSSDLPDIHVQTAIFANDSSGPTHEATVSWVEKITENGFIACIETAGPVPVSRTIKLQWMAYLGSPGTGLAGKAVVSLFTAGTQCVDIDFIGKTFPSAPYVYVTAIHTKTFENSHDAMSVWAEGATQYSFKACLRELKSFDGVHESIIVDWLALEGVPSGWTIPFGKAITMPNTATLTSATHYSFCQDITFDKGFYATPVMITTALHNTDKNNPKAVLPDHNAITEWIESVSISGFTVCMKDIQPFDGHHDPVNIEYLAIGDLDPCIDVVCDYYATCKAFGPKDARCVCPEKCDDFEDQKCGSDGVTYKNMCELKKAICNQRKNITVVHDGPCFPFILHRGRVLLILDTIEVQCKTITYSEQNFLPNYRVHVQATVNYYSSGINASFTHDAAVAWTEEVNINNFTVCALKAGRNDRATPDGGYTYVDYIAYQGSPAGAVAGKETLANWWDGTTCTTATLPSGKFSSAPYVVVSAQHGVLGQKHDAATTWIEDITTSSFKICLRELQNFDGLHEDIKVDWMAYQKLPPTLSSEQHKLDFTNDYVPLARDNNAFCKTMTFNKQFSNGAPTVIVSPGHSTAGLNRLIPDYNSIAAWVEHIGTTAARVCIKELHSPNGYDPVLLSSLVIGT